MNGRSDSASALELALAPLLGAAAMAFAAAVRVRGVLYDRGILPSIDPGIPVVSVGNVTAGGTGKTPIVEALARALSERGRRPAIISRGYGGQEKGPARIPRPSARGDGAERSRLARRFGDEPTWLSLVQPEVPVIVGRDRVAAARLAKAEGAECAVADDAFQHRRLARQFDVAVLDATEPLRHYWPLPFGRAREPLAALRRAHAVILNKSNLVSEERARRIRAAAQAVLEGRKPLWLEASYRIGAVASLSGEERPADSLAGTRVFLATAIGRPAAFDATLRTSIGRIRVQGSRAFADHHLFCDEDLRAVEQEALRVGAEAIVVSEKDAIKLGSWEPRLPVWVTRLSVAPHDGWDGLNREIDRILF